MLALLLCSTALSAGEPRRVLMVHPFSYPQSPWSDMADSFRAELVKKSAEPIQFYEVSLNAESGRQPEDEGPFVDYILELLSRRAPDLIVPIGAPAAFFVQHYRSTFFTATPMLIVGADVRRIPAATLTRSDTAVFTDFDAPVFVENILHVRPETTEISIVIGDSPVERFWISEMRRELQPLTARVNLKWFNELTFSEMLKRAAAMPPGSAIFWMGPPADAAGVPYSEMRAFTTMHAAASAPIFAVGDFEMGRGTVGGRLMQTHFLGQEAAEVAIRILKGEAPSGIKPVIVPLGSPIYDWRELQRWGIREALLPRGSVIQYREPSVWQRYRWAIGSAATLILLETALILSLLYERRRRRNAEIEATSRFSELAHMNRRAAVGELSASLAHELRQPVSVILRDSDVAKMILKEPSPDLSELKDVMDSIGRANERSAEIIVRLQRLLSKAPPDTQEIDLNQVVREVFELLTPQASVRDVTLSVNLATPAPRVGGDRIQLQQVVLNLVINALDAIEGANSRERTIKGRTVFLDDNAAEVSIEDSGPGILADKLEHIFDPFFTTKQTGMGMGLSIARTIVRSHRGRIWAENQHDGGAVFRFTLPIAEHSQELARKSADSLGTVSLTVH
jgi:signal transduction histidine kinase